MRRSLVLMLVFFVGTASALAHQLASAPSTRVTAAVDTGPAKQKKICRETEQTGSRLNVVKQCATAAEWERMYREQRETLERQQSGGSHIPGGGF